MTLKMDEKVGMRDAFSEALLDISKTDSTVYALDGDLGNSTKLSVIAEENPEKFLQMGIAEQNMMGVAAGMASAGLQPWTCSFAAFICKRSIDQIAVTIAQPNLDVKMIGSYSGLLTGLTGKTHQGLEDLAIMRTLVNMVVLAPADAVEVKEAMKFAHEYNGPVYIRLARDPMPILFDEEKYKFELGKGVTLKKGKDLTIISTGTQTSRSLETAQLLKEKGLDVAVLHLGSIKPIDKEAILKAAEETRLLVTAEEHSIYGGLGSAVTEIVSEHCPVPVKRIGVDDKNAESAANDALLKKHKLDPESMAATIQTFVADKRG
ncbi:transketolase family protein [Priestia endophytica]|uniref:transketolase family protein n=1 Tax=Priestia endophytica TaxID=135735 RepID=UPI000DCA7A6A|nr:transketolase C-terminal domain-containing protein [Priestia endophytica]RAS86363.1 transketolase [Priestia endophytica]